MSVVIKYFDRISETPGMIPTTVVSLVLFFAWLAQVIGAPEILGGFAASLALSRRFSEQYLCGFDIGHCLHNGVVAILD